MANLIQRLFKKIFKLEDMKFCVTTEDELQVVQATLSQLRVEYAQNKKKGTFKQ